MDSDRELTADDDATLTAEHDSWGKATLPAEIEPEETELEEAEGDDEDEGHVESHELVEVDANEPAPGTLANDAVLAQAKALLEEAGSDFDLEAYANAIREAGAAHIPLSPEDFPLAMSYVEALSEQDVGAAEIGKGIAWYLKMNAGAAEQRHETDLADAGRVQDELKAEWGRDYESNIAESKRFLGSHPGIADALTSARMADGSLLLHQEGFPDFLLSFAKGRSTPAQREAPVPSTPKERLSQIEQVLRTDSHRYFRDKLDEEAITLRRQLEKTTPRSAGPGVAHLESQLSTLKKIMATDPDRYWKENMSQRAIEIRRQLEQIAKADAARGR